MSARLVHHRGVVTLVVLPATLMTGLAGAVDQNAGGDDLQQLRKEVGELRARIDALDQEKAKTSGMEDMPGMGEAGGWVPQLTIRGFGDVTLSGSRTKPDGAAATDDNHFALGQFVLFLSSQVSEDITFTGEMSFETGDTGDTGVDVERMILKYNLKDLLNSGWISSNIQLGRFHTTLGYWNEIYHHGEWMQTTIGRPRALRFEDGGGILPVHLVGVVSKSSLTLGSIALDPTVEVGNGRGPTSDPPQVVYDRNNNKAVNVALAIRPILISGLRFGVSAFFDRIPAYANTGPTDPNPSHGNIDERIYNAYVVYNPNPWEFIAEYYYLQHRPVDNATPIADTQTYYAQFAYKLGKFTPYVRYDVVRISDADTYFVTTADTATASVGLRWDISAWNALKLQYERTRTRAAAGGVANSTEHAILLQDSFAF